MKKVFQSFIIILSVAAFCVSCSKNQISTSNWMSDYEVPIAIDESFRPIMENLVQSFAMAHPEAKMKPIYVNEDSAVRLLVNDSVRCVIVTRKVNDREAALIKGNTLAPTQAFIASDAIALVTNRQNLDSLITIDEVKAIVTGRITRWEQLKHHSKSGELKLVFDNSRSSTVRYMRDSLCEGKDLQGNVFASVDGTNLSVLDMVKKDPSYIGVVGANWLMGDNQEALSNFNNLDVKVMNVKGANQYDHYVKPYQLRIATGEYPLHRAVYIIHTDPRTQSMLRNFFFFVKGQKGQTIICNNSQLLPNSPVEIKDVSIE